MHLPSPELGTLLYPAQLLGALPWSWVDHGAGAGKAGVTIKGLSSCPCRAVSWQYPTSPLGPAELCWEGCGVDNTSLTPFLRSHSCGSHARQIALGQEVSRSPRSWVTSMGALIYMHLGLQGDPGCP